MPESHSRESDAGHRRHGVKTLTLLQEDGTEWHNCANPRCGIAAQPKYRAVLISPRSHSPISSDLFPFCRDGRVRTFHDSAERRRRLRGESKWDRRHAREKGEKPGLRVENRAGVPCPVLPDFRRMFRCGLRPSPEHPAAWLTRRVARRGGSARDRRQCRSTLPGATRRSLRHEYGSAQFRDRPDKRARNWRGVATVSCCRHQCRCCRCALRRSPRCRSAPSVCAQLHPEPVWRPAGCCTC